MKPSPSPRFSIRGANLCESLLRHTPEQLTTFLARMEEWRMNTLLVHVAYGFGVYGEQLERECKARGIDIVYYIQTSLLFLDGIAPALFAKDREGNVRTPELCNETRLCVSNPEAQTAFRHGAQRYFSSLQAEARKRFLFIDSDGYLFCECPDCAKLGPVEQWVILYRIILEEGARSGRDLAFWYLSYVWRYRLPVEMELFQQVEAVVFDTHQRCRWAALGEEHALSAYNDLEAKGDPRAASVPLNIYLADRLAEWRAAYQGKLIVFENLMLQGSISCPQPYTPQLLQDLDLYEDGGVDGVLYEAFEPGIESFSRQLDAISRGLWERPVCRPPASHLERACHQYLREEVPARFNYKNQFNVLSYLTTPAFDGPGLLTHHTGDPILIAYTTQLREFLITRTRQSCAEVLKYALQHQARFDWIMIAFNLLRAAEPPLKGVTTEQREFLESDKLWDWMERQPQPLTAAERMIRLMINRLEANEG